MKNILFFMLLIGSCLNSWSQRPVLIQIVNEMTCLSCAQLTRAVNDMEYEMPGKVIAVSAYGFYKPPYDFMGVDAGAWVSKYWGVGTRKPIFNGDKIVIGDEISEPVNDYANIVKDSLVKLAEELYQNEVETIGMSIDPQCGENGNCIFNVNLDAKKDYSADDSLALFVYVISDSLEYYRDYAPKHPWQNSRSMHLENVIRDVLPVNNGEYGGELLGAITTGEQKVVPIYYGNREETLKPDDMARLSTIAYVMNKNNKKIVAVVQDKRHFYSLPTGENPSSSVDLTSSATENSSAVHLSSTTNINYYDLSSTPEVRIHRDGIFISNWKSDNTISIYSMNGKKIWFSNYRSNIKSQNFFVPYQSLPIGAGKYFLKIENKNSTIYSNVIQIGE